MQLIIIMYEDDNVNNENKGIEGESGDMQTYRNRLNDYDIEDNIDSDI